MRVLVQWTQTSPADWAELDLADARSWERTPRKPEPRVTSETVDATPGWVFEVNCQGVIFGGFDHYVCEQGPADSAIVTVWNDDSADWNEGERWAEVWTFQTLAADPRFGGALNTRQSRVVYAEALAAPRFEGVENTVVRPWTEFVPPRSSVVRHGVTVANALAQEHVQRQSLHGWREWA